MRAHCHVLEAVCVCSSLTSLTLIDNQRQAPNVRLAALAGHTALVSLTLEGGSREGAVRIPPGLVLLTQLSLVTRGISSLEIPPGLDSLLSLSLDHNWLLSLPPSITRLSSLTFLSMQDLGVQLEEPLPLLALPMLRELQLLDRSAYPHCAPWSKKTLNAIADAQQWCKDQGRDLQISF